MESGAEWLAPEEQVLREIAQAGYADAPVSLEGNHSAQQTIELYARYGLRPAPGYIGTALWNRARCNEILERVRHQASFARAVGSTDFTDFYVAPGGFDYVTSSGKPRNQLVRHVHPKDSLTDEKFQNGGRPPWRVASQDCQRNRNMEDLALEYTLTYFK